MKKDTRDDFRGCKKLRKVKPIYVEVKLKQSMFD